MNLAETNKHLGLTVQYGWRVHFNRYVIPRARKNLATMSDCVPGKGEPAFPTEEAAEEYANMMRRKMQIYIKDANCNRRCAIRDGLKVLPTEPRPRWWNIHVKQDEPEPIHIGPPKIYAYCRVSTDRQDRECLVQKDAITLYVQRLIDQGVLWEEAFYVDAAVSGGTEFVSRPAGMMLHNRLHKGDHVVIHKGDRAFRNSRDALNMLDIWDKMGVIVHIIHMNYVSSDAVMSKLVFTIMAAVSEMERGFIRERTTEAKRIRKAAGFYGGGKTIPRFCYFDHGKIHLCPRTLVFMRHIWHWTTKEGYENREVERRLAFLGSPIFHHRLAFADQREMTQSVAKHCKLFYESMAISNDPACAVAEIYPLVPFKQSKDRWLEAIAKIPEDGPTVAGIDQWIAHNKPKVK